MPSLYMSAPSPGPSSIRLGFSRLDSGKECGFGFGIDGEILLFCGPELGYVMTERRKVKIDKINLLAELCVLRKRDEGSVG